MYLGTIDVGARRKIILLIGDEPLGLDKEEYEDYSESEPEQLYGAPALGEYGFPEEAKNFLKISYTNL